MKMKIENNPSMFIWQAKCTIGSTILTFSPQLTWNLPESQIGYLKLLVPGFLNVCQTAGEISNEQEIVIQAGSYLYELLRILAPVMANQSLVVEVF